MHIVPFRRFRSVLALLLALPSSGCLTRPVLALGGGIEWSDSGTPPPQSRIVPDTLVFCARGNLEVYAEAFPPEGIQWSGRPAPPVRVFVIEGLGSQVPPISEVRRGHFTYFDVSEDACRPIAKRARLAIPPESWQAESGARCDGAPVLRTVALAPGEATVDLDMELHGVIATQRLEVVALSDLRPPLALREPRPAAYALLPLALAADGAGYAVEGALIAVGFSPILAAVVLVAPSYPVYALGDEIFGRGNPASASPGAVDRCAERG